MLPILHATGTSKSRNEMASLDQVNIRSAVFGLRNDSKRSFLASFESLLLDRSFWANVIE